MLNNENQHIMKATAKINNLTSLDSKHIIVRNLSRILDIRIMDIDLESRTVSLVYDSRLAFEKAKNELRRIGFPITKCSYQPPIINSVLPNYQLSRIRA